MNNSKQLILRVTASDCVWTTTRGHGKGGQHRNKTDTAVRVVHPPSGAVGFSQDERSQLRNKRAAFKRMFHSDAFQKWLKIETSIRLGAIKSDEELLQEIDRDLEDPTKTLVEYL